MAVSPESILAHAPGDSFAAFSSSVIAATYLAATTARAPRTAPPVSAVSASNRRRFHPNLAPSPFSLSAVPSASRFAACRPSAAAQTFAGLEDEKLALVMELAFAPSTRAGYGTGLGHFLSWCEDNGIDEQLRCPASEELLTRFVAAQAGHFSGDYIAKRISAVGAWHKTYGAPWCFRPGSSLSLALRGALAMTPPSSKRPPRDPYTPAYLRSMLPHFDMGDPLDRAVWACALCAFWGLARVGEVTVPTQKTFDPTYHITRSGWVPRPVLPSSPSAGVLRLPWTKTTRREGAMIEPDLCPVTALAAHIQQSPLPDTWALFAYSKNRRSVRLSRSVFLTRLKCAA